MYWIFWIQFFKEINIHQNYCNDIKTCIQILKYSLDEVIIKKLWIYMILVIVKFKTKRFQLCQEMFYMKDASRVLTFCDKISVIRFLSGKYCVWKLKKTLICHKICNFKTNTTYFKKISFEMQLNRGINIYLFASKYICSLSEWVKIQYSRQKNSRKFIFHVRKFWRGEKRRNLRQMSL